MVQQEELKCWEIKDVKPSELDVITDISKEQATGFFLAGTQETKLEQSTFTKKGTAQGVGSETIKLILRVTSGHSSVTIHDSQQFIPRIVHQNYKELGKVN